MAPPEPRFVPQWLRAVAGLAIWGAHLGAVYAWTALACARQFGDWTLHGVGVVAVVNGALTLLALAGAAAVLLSARNRRRAAGGEAQRLIAGLSALGAALALVAIAWSGLPAMVVARPCG